MSERQLCLRWAAALPVLMLCLVGACGSERSVPLHELGVWSEFLPLGEVREHLPALAEYRARLYLAIEPTQLDETLRDFLAEAGDVGVEVGLWLQLPDGGVWLNELNAGQFAQFSGDLLEWAAANDIDIDTVIFDIEPSFDYTEDLAEAATSGELLEFVNLFADHHSPLRFEAARNTIRRMVDRLQSQGVTVMAVTLPWVLDDIRDLDSDLQDLFDMPVTGIAWDRVAFMLYRSSASDLLGRTSRRNLWLSTRDPSKSITEVAAR